MNDDAATRHTQPPMIMYAPPKLKDNSLLRGKCLIGGEWLDAVGGGTIVVHNHSSGKRHALGGTFFESTILVDASADMQIFREETFGPVAPVFRFKTEQEAIRLANDTEFGLAAYFYGRDIGRVWRVGEALEYGMIGINEGMISTEIAPFGGIKESGNGREGSKYGIEDYLEIKYLCMGGLG